MHDKTIPPQNRADRRSGVWVTMRDHAKSKNGGWKSWAAAIFWGKVIAAIGIGIVKLIPAAPWWVAVLFIAAGLNTATRGAFLAALKPIKDGVIEVLKVRKE